MPASGPLTQATGPPRLGAGLGVGMLRGAGDSLMYLKIQKLPNSHFKFLIDMKFISKLLEMFFYGQILLSDPHLRKI